MCGNMSEDSVTHSVPGTYTEGAKPELAASLASSFVWKSCVKPYQDFSTVLRVSGGCWLSVCRSMLTAC